MIPGRDTLNTKKTLKVGDKSYAYYSLKEAEGTLGDVSRLPFSLKVLLENLLRFEDGRSVEVEDVKAFSDWLKNGKTSREIAYRPARVLMQDFTGVPAVVDLPAMRDAMKNLGEDPEKINPLAPVDLVIDYSVMVDFFGGPNAFEKNVDREYERNGERYKFLKWGQGALLFPPALAFAIRSIWNILLKLFGQQSTKGRHLHIPIRWWEQIAIQLWSMVLPFLDGASVVLRPKRQCSVNRFPCSFLRS